jgi:hypothetical protein
MAIVTLSTRTKNEVLKEEVIKILRNKLLSEKK